MQIIYNTLVKSQLGTGLGVLTRIWSIVTFSGFSWLINTASHVSETFTMHTKFMFYHRSQKGQCIRGYSALRENEVQNLVENDKLSILQCEILFLQLQHGSSKRRMTRACLPDMRPFLFFVQALLFFSLTALELQKLQV